MINLHKSLKWVILFSGLFVIISLIWQFADILELGKVQPSLADSIACAVISWMFANRLEARP